MVGLKVGSVEGGVEGKPFGKLVGSTKGICDRFSVGINEVGVNVGNMVKDLIVC